MSAEGLPELLLSVRQALQADNWLQAERLLDEYHGRIEAIDRSGATPDADSLRRIELEQRRTQLLLQRHLQNGRDQQEQMTRIRSELAQMAALTTAIEE